MQGYSHCQMVPFIIIIIYMSLFLLEQRQFHQKLPGGNIANQNLDKLDGNQQNIFNTQIYPKFQSDIELVPSRAHNADKKEWHLFQCLELVGKLKGLFFLKASSTGMKLSTRVKLLGPHQYFFKLQSGYQLPQIYRKILSNHLHFKKTPIKISVNGSNREIQISLPDYIGQDSRYIFSSLMKNQGREDEVFHKIVRPHLQSTKHILKKLFRDENKYGLEDSKEKQQLEYIQRYVEISNTPLHLPFNQRIRNKEFRKVLNEDIKKVLNKRAKLSPYLGKNADIYNFDILREISSKFRGEYSLSDSQCTFMERQLELPIEVFRKEESVLNYIYLKNENISMKKINEGGFSDIYTAGVDFWFLPSEFVNSTISKLEKEFFTEQHLVKKEMVIKKEIPPDFSQKHEVFKGRVEHQIDILKTIKKEKPIFLPKYYVPKNKNTFFNQSLFIDHIESNTLAQLLKNQGSTLSLATKLYLMYSIAQSIRSLREYRIVHLDLKPSNILMHYKMLIKLIDFGQSYHPNVTDMEYTPGFTIPYSCPELFSNSSFTSSSDVFSMGVIFFEMLYNKCPFNFFTRTTHLDSVMDDYEQKWFFSPEESQTYGQMQVFRILNGMISKCLSRNAHDRPGIDWIAITLRCLIDFVN